jgi:hypothetical protein
VPYNAVGSSGRPLTCRRRKTLRVVQPKASLGRSLSLSARSQRAPLSLRGTKLLTGRENPKDNSRG